MTEHTETSIELAANYGGKTFQSLRWSINQASAEFAIDRAALSKRLRAEGIEPGDDGRFSTQQICAAKFNSAERERTRKNKEDADRVMMANEVTRRELVPISEVIELHSEIAVVLRQEIMALDLPLDDRERILRCLQASMNAYAESGLVSKDA